MREPEPVLVVDLFPVERQHLLQLLARLREEEWHRPTVCAGWTVKDIALHLLGDDTGRLSRDRDEALQHATISGNESLARKVFDTVSIIA